MRALAMLLTAPCLMAQQDFAQDSGRALLLQVRKKVMATVDRLPRYLCTETVDRATLAPESTLTNGSCDYLAMRRQEPDWKVYPYTSDRLRLDVAVSSDHEMYSWAGEDRFGDRSLQDLVRSGATSTGAFASFLTALFGTNVADFAYDGSMNVDGRALVSFGFHVPLENSGYRITNRRHSFLVPYEGKILVNPQTSDLVRLTVIANQLPAELSACEDITTLDYGSVRLNNSEFLLPKEARLQVIYGTGSESVNRTVFSGCHEFTGESSLQFDPVLPDEAPTNKPAPAAVTLPANIRFRVMFTGEIDTATAAAGDLIRGELEGPIKINGDVVIPKKAAVTGRIVQVKRSYGRASTMLAVGIKLETIEAHGTRQPFPAMLESRVKKPIRTSGAAAIARNLGSFDQMADPDAASAGILEIPDVSEDYVIHRGLEMDGITTPSK